MLRPLYKPEKISYNRFRIEQTRGWGRRPAVVFEKRAAAAEKRQNDEGISPITPERIGQSAPHEADTAVSRYETRQAHVGKT